MMTIRQKKNYSISSSLKESVSSKKNRIGTLDQFRDSESREKRFQELVGRSWSVKELRRKSFEDLHRLWYVLYKEKNMILTESNIARVNSVFFPQPERKRKVKRSMAAIKCVLGEREREAKSNKNKNEESRTLNGSVGSNEKHQAT